MNGLFALMGIETWKPIITALLLPPVPFLLLVLIGARLILPRRGLGWLIILFSIAGIWLSNCTGAGRLLETRLMSIPSPLDAERIAAIKREAKTSAVAIVVLGGGLEPYAPEYGVTNLGYASLERLRYAIWLHRETDVPMAFSGGVGWSQSPGMSEAEVAARIAAQDFGRPLRWTETQSRDTRENAQRTVPMLKRAGITHIVLVTHGVHMPRAQRAFAEAAAESGIRIEAAPMGLARRTEVLALEWLPTPQGFMRVRDALRESLGRLMGA